MDTHRTLKRKIKALLRRILGHKLENCNVSNIETVAFDVFDTLIVRSGLTDPSDVFGLVEGNTLVELFRSNRLFAEKAARDQAHKCGRDEVTIDEIYDKLSDLYGWNTEECLRIKSEEISVELSVCKANVEALNFYKQLLNMNKRILVVSDMYLGKKEIRNILKNAGFSVPDSNIFISSEYGVTKKTGKLYEEVLKETNVDKSKIIMIGDNVLSDYWAPKKKGIKAFLYK